LARVFAAERPGQVLSQEAYLDEQTDKDTYRLHNHRIKLLCGGQVSSVLGFHLPLPEHMFASNGSFDGQRRCS
jgi:hypothetical protein